MGRIFLTGNTSGTSTNALAYVNDSDLNQSHSTVQVQSDFANSTGEIESLHSILQRTNSLIRSIERDMAGGGASHLYGIREESISFKNQLETDLRRRLNSEEPIHYSDSRDYARRLDSIMDNNNPTTRQGYHYTSIPFNFTLSSEGQLSHRRSSSDSE